MPKGSFVSLVTPGSKQQTSVVNTHLCLALLSLCPLAETCSFSELLFNPQLFFFSFKNLHRWLTEKTRLNQAFVCFWGVSWSRTVKGKGFWLFRTQPPPPTPPLTHSLTHSVVSVNLFNKSKKYYLMVPVVRKLNNEALLAADQPLAPCSALLADCLSFHASHSFPASGRPAGVPHPGV